jgi:DNA-binding response OmpR family regulator/signal transduction histidine kinase
LFVDDEPDVLEVLRHLFERRLEVLTVNSGEEALKLLRTGTVDLLVTDQKMPEMTGIQLVAQARSEGIEITTILLTAYTQPADLIAAINEGQVYRYVTKPWDINDLTMTVKNALEAVQLRKDKERLVDSLRKRVEALSVMYEVSRESANDAPTHEAIVDRLLSVVGRVLPHDCSAALIDPSDGHSLSLRIRCQSALGEKALLNVKETVLMQHRKATGVILPEDRVLTRVNVVGREGNLVGGPSSFSSSLVVPLVTGGQVVGTLALFSAKPETYSTEDGELLDLLVNQVGDAISSLRAAESAHRTRIERMVEAMVDGVVLTDERNQVVVMNSAAKLLLKLNENSDKAPSRMLEEKLGFAPYEMVRGWEYGGQKVFRDQLKLGDRTVHLTVSPVADPAGALKGVVLAMRDVTEQKLLEDRKDEFVSMVSHELRTPLTSITGALDLVLNFISGDINDKQRRYLEMARDSTEKLNALVDDLLDLSKFAKGHMRMNFEFTHLDQLVQRVVEKYSPAFSEKGIALSVEVPPTSVKILADPNRLQQVFNNLLTNAVKFTPENGHARVEVKTSEGAPGFVFISVWNSGEPIAEADLTRIFDRFEQARTARTRTIRGTGLGLSICRNIVEAHGGRIWAEPVPTGARFVAVLPAEPATEYLNPMEQSLAQQQGAPPPVPRGSVLIIEDSFETASILKASLLMRHFAVYVATTGDEGLSLARKVRPDIICLDIALPDYDGLKLAEIFRHDPDTRAAPLLIFSGFDERQEALRRAEAFMLKPLRPDAFIASIDGLMSRNRRRKGKVVVVDDDAQIRAVCCEVLANSGFETLEAGTLAEARRHLADARPDLLLLDVVLPDGDGLTFFEELKAERASQPLSVIFISAKTDTSSKVRALKLGGDDYLTKPFDALELGARVESVMMRRSAEAVSSPTTHLPGSAAIEREVLRRLKEEKPFAFCYLDLDNLKAYNDYYGFAKADGVVRQTGDLLREIFAREAMQSDFLGHVAGDDFVFICSAGTVDVVCEKVIEAFDRIIPLYYDQQDRERGYIEAEDRFGERRRFPVMSVSIVAVMSDGVSADHSDLARSAAELKKKAKAVVGSVYLRSDRLERAKPTIAPAS